MKMDVATGSRKARQRNRDFLVNSDDVSLGNHEMDSHLVIENAYPSPCSSNGVPESTENLPSSDKKDKMKKKLYSFLLLSTHIVVKKQIRMYRCDVCGATYRHVFSLKRHFLRNHISIKYISKSDLSNCKINTHGQLTEAVESDSDVSSVSSHSSSTKKRRQANDAKSETEQNSSMTGLYRCHLCKDIQFDTKSELKEHFQKHPSSSKLRFHCEKCDSAFSHKQTLFRHLATTHSGSSTFPCSTCGRSFENKIAYAKHVATHTESNTCKYCTKVLSTKANKRRHERIHEGLKPYPCKHCTAQFSQSGDLKKHLKKQHDVSYLSCSLCTGMFSSKTSLNKHMMDRHAIQPSPEQCEQVQPISQTVVKENQPNVVRQLFTDQQPASSGKSPVKPKKPIQDNVNNKSEQNPGKNYSSRFAKIQTPAESFPVEVNPVIQKVYPCTVCRKTYRTYISMLSHRRQNHPFLHRTRKVNKKQAYYDRNRIKTKILKKRKAPCMTDEEFYNSVSRTIADNLLNYVDGKTSQLSIRQYNFSDQMDHSNIPARKWTSYNFPNNFDVDQALRIKGHEIKNRNTEAPPFASSPILNGFSLFNSYDYNVECDDSSSDLSSAEDYGFCNRMYLDYRKIDVEERKKLIGKEVNSVVLCCVCKEKFMSVTAFEEHSINNHPNVLCTCIEIEGDKDIPPVVPEALKWQFLSPTGVYFSCSVPPPISNQSDVKCTKCNSSFSSASDLHQHIISCGGKQLMTSSHVRKISYFRKIKRTMKSRININFKPNAERKSVVKDEVPVTSKIQSSNERAKQMVKSYKILPFSKPGVGRPRMLLNINCSNCKEIFRTKGLFNAHVKRCYKKTVMKNKCRNVPLQKPNVPLSGRKTESSIHGKLSPVEKNVVPRKATNSYNLQQSMSFQLVEPLTNVPRLSSVNLPAKLFVSQAGFSEPEVTFSAYVPSSSLPQRTSTLIPAVVSVPKAVDELSFSEQTLISSKNFSASAILSKGSGLPLNLSTAVPKTASKPQVAAATGPKIASHIVRETQVSVPVTFPASVNLNSFAAGHAHTVGSESASPSVTLGQNLQTSTQGSVSDNKHEVRMQLRTDTSRQTPSPSLEVLVNCIKEKLSSEELSPSHPTFSWMEDEHLMFPPTSHGSVQKSVPPLIVNKISPKHEQDQDVLIRDSASEENSKLERNDSVRANYTKEFEAKDKSGADILEGEDSENTSNVSSRHMLLSTIENAGGAISSEESTCFSKGKESTCFSKGEHTSELDLSFPNANSTLTKRKVGLNVNKSGKITAEAHPIMTNKSKPPASPIQVLNNDAHSINDVSTSKMQCLDITSKYKKRPFKTITQVPSLSGTKVKKSKAKVNETNLLTSVASATSSSKSGGTGISPSINHNSKKYKCLDGSSSSEFPAFLKKHLPEVLCNNHSEANIPSTLQYSSAGSKMKESVHTVETSSITPVVRDKESSKPDFKGLSPTSKESQKAIHSAFQHKEISKLQNSDSIKTSAFVGGSSLKRTNVKQKHKCQGCKLEFVRLANFEKHKNVCREHRETNVPLPAISVADLVEIKNSEERTSLAQVAATHTVKYKNAKGKFKCAHCKLEFVHETNFHKHISRCKENQEQNIPLPNISAEDLSEKASLKEGTSNLVKTEVASNLVKTDNVMSYKYMTYKGKYRCPRCIRVFVHLSNFCNHQNTCREKVENVDDPNFCNHRNTCSEKEENVDDPDACAESFPEQNMKKSEFSELGNRNQPHKLNTSASPATRRKSEILKTSAIVQGDCANPSTSGMKALGQLKPSSSKTSISEAEAIAVSPKNICAVSSDSTTSVLHEGKYDVVPKLPNSEDHHRTCPYCHLEYAYINNFNKHIVLCKEKYDAKSIEVASQPLVQSSSPLFLPKKDEVEESMLNLLRNQSRQVQLMKEAKADDQDEVKRFQTYTCDICHRIFLSLFKLLQHIVVHKLQKPGEQSTFSTDSNDSKPELCDTESMEQPSSEEMKVHCSELLSNDSKDHSVEVIPPSDPVPCTLHQDIMPPSDPVPCTLHQDITDLQSMSDSLSGDSEVVLGECFKNIAKFKKPSVQNASTTVSVSNDNNEGKDCLMNSSPCETSNALQIDSEENSQALSNTQDVSDDLFSMTDLVPSSSTECLKKNSLSKVPLPRRDLFSMTDLMPSSSTECLKKNSPSKVPLPRRTCSLCNKVFSNLGNLRRHLQNIHGKEPSVVTPTAVTVKKANTAVTVKKAKTSVDKPVIRTAKKFMTKMAKRHAFKRGCKKQIIGEKGVIKKTKLFTGRKKKN